MLETPKKKSRIWVAISNNLKDNNIFVTSDQVRWKINALTKKYKRCLYLGKHEKFKHYKEMDRIYSKYMINCHPHGVKEFMNGNNDDTDSKSIIKSVETREMIEMRKVRLANRIEADRFQAKIKLERQWLQYLQKQEEQSQWRDELFERTLKLKEEELEICKKELELNKSLEYKKLKLMENQQDQILKIEREKCELLKQLFHHHI